MKRVVKYGVYMDAVKYRHDYKMRGKSSPRSLSSVRDYSQSQKVLESIAQTAPDTLRRRAMRPSKGCWQSLSVLVAPYKDQVDNKLSAVAEKRY